jgi:AcrR family transcriptional regulator
MRADARRNRTRLIEAALDLLLESGREPPLDAVARNAGVGIGTLYRHFPDRNDLLNGVADCVLDRAVEAAEAALADSNTGHDALRQYMHAAVRGGVGALNLLHPLVDAPDWSAQRERVAPLLLAILQRGRDDGSLREDVQVVDIVFAVIRHSRPVHLRLPRSEERAIAHRHLDQYLDGIRNPRES